MCNTLHAALRKFCPIPLDVLGGIVKPVSQTSLQVG